jgi:dihydrolipoamide dehydrogenase
MAEPYVVKMPQLSDTMTEGTLVSWEKNIGDFISRGTVVATVETDKAIMDVEVFREGYLSGPLTPVNTVVPVGAAIGQLVATPEEVKRDGASAPASAATQVKPEKQPAAPQAEAAPDTAAPAGAYAIKMPQLSDTMTEGTLVSWEKNVGDFINRGTVVATVETDKAIMDVEVFREGYLSGPLLPVNSVVPVGEAIAYLVNDAKQTVNTKAETPVTRPAITQSARRFEPSGTPMAKTRIAAMPHGGTPAPRPRKGGATPYARQLAGAHGIDINSLKGSAPGSVIVAADVMNDAGPKVQAKRIFQVPGAGRPMDSMEKAVSHSMEYSLSMPLFRVTIHLAPERLIAASKKAAVSLTVALAKASALAIQKHPRVNAVYQHEDRILEREQIDVGLAVETEGMGLVVPVLRNVLRRSLGELNAEWKDLVARAAPAQAARILQPDVQHFQYGHAGGISVRCHSRARHLGHLCRRDQRRARHAGDHYRRSSHYKRRGCGEIFKYL